MAKVAVYLKYMAELNNAVARMMVMETHDRQLTFPIIIAETEALCLMKELDNVRAKRPQTHDLMDHIMEEFQINLHEVYIHKFLEGIFYTEMTCECNGRIVAIDSRASDAVIMALKKNCPIYVDSTVLDKVALPSSSLGEEEEEAEDLSAELNAAFVNAVDPGDYSTKSVQELEQMLEDAVEVEDYELATVIRDELSSRLQKK